MQTDYERVIKQFLPVFRLNAARLMVKEYGIRQQQAAVFLGTTQAAISKYLKSSPITDKNVRIDTDTLREFISSIRAGDEKNAQKIMCGMCQLNKKFDCAFMINR